MRNPLTFRIESWVGVVFLVGLTSLLIGFMYTAMANFDSDMGSLSMEQSGASQAKHPARLVLSATERGLMDDWLAENSATVTIPSGVDHYNFLVKKYPSKPWLK